MAVAIKMFKIKPVPFHMSTSERYVCQRVCMRVRKKSVPLFVVARSGAFFNFNRFYSFSRFYFQPWSVPEAAPDADINEEFAKHG